MRILMLLHVFVFIVAQLAYGEPFWTVDYSEYKYIDRDTAIETYMATSSNMFVTVDVYVDKINEKKGVISKTKVYHRMVCVVDESERLDVMNGDLDCFLALDCNDPDRYGKDAIQVNIHIRSNDENGDDRLRACWQYIELPDTDESLSVGLSAIRRQIDLVKDKCSYGIDCVIQDDGVFKIIK